MKTKVYKYFSFLYQDYRILKLSFSALTLYLLMYELHTFYVVKPTLQSVTQSQLLPRYFPDVLLCPRQPFILQELHQAGYELRKGSDNSLLIERDKKNRSMIGKLNKMK